MNRVLEEDPGAWTGPVPSLNIRGHAAGRTPTHSLTAQPGGARAGLWAPPSLHLPPLSSPRWIPRDKKRGEGVLTARLSSQDTPDLEVSFSRSGARESEIKALTDLGSGSQTAPSLCPHVGKGMGGCPWGPLNDGPGSSVRALPAKGPPPRAVACGLDLKE